MIDTKTPPIKAKLNADVLELRVLRDYILALEETRKQPCKSDEWLADSKEYARIAVMHGDIQDKIDKEGKDESGNPNREKRRAATTSNKSRLEESISDLQDKYSTAIIGLIQGNGNFITVSYAGGQLKINCSSEANSYKLSVKSEKDSEKRLSQQDTVKNGLREVFPEWKIEESNIKTTYSIANPGENFTRFGTYLASGTFTYGATKQKQLTLKELYDVLQSAEETINKVDTVRYTANGTKGPR